MSPRPAACAVLACGTYVGSWPATGKHVTLHLAVHVPLLGPLLENVTYVGLARLMLYRSPVCTIDFILDAFEKSVFESSQ